MILTLLSGFLIDSRVSGDFINFFKINFANREDLAKEMDSVKNVISGIFYGLWDSVSGFTFVLSIDNELYRLEEEMEQKAKFKKRMEDQRRSPSPTPSSASSMEREERRKAARVRAERGNPDERTLESIRKSSNHDEGSEKPKREKKIAKKVLKCCLLNGGFTWMSIVLFEYVMLPTLRFVLSMIYGEKSDDLHSVWSWLHPILSIIFGMMWVLPIFLLSRIVSSLWFADIANAAYRVRKGRPQLIPGFSKLIADFLFSLVIQALFLVQSMLVNLFSIMYVGQFLSFIHLCLLYSLYSFEYKWFNMGWELNRRLVYIEDNWPYFLGFGVPLTILTSLTNSIIVSGCIFSMFFPLFILSGNEAKPIVGTTQTPLRLFVPVIFVSNLFFRKRREKRMLDAKSQNRKDHQQYDPLLTKEERFQLHQMQREHNRELIARRSSSRVQQKETKSAAKTSKSSDDDESEYFFKPSNFKRKATEDAAFLSDLEESVVGMRPALVPIPVPTPTPTCVKGPTNAQF